MDEVLTTEDILKIFEQDPEEALDISLQLAYNIVQISDEVGLEFLDMIHKNIYLLSVIVLYMNEKYVPQEIPTLTTIH